jgi:hypothetical protein
LPSLAIRGGLSSSALEPRRAAIPSLPSPPLNGAGAVDILFLDDDHLFAIK